MSQLSYTSFVDGDQPLAAGFNSRFLLAINLLNSGIEADNIASNAITTAKIINDAVTTAKLAHPVLFEKSSDIASATTTDLSTATGNCADITGTTTITSFGTVQSGSIFYLRFTGILTLTHNATSLILPTGANITTQAGDCAAFESLGSGNWVCVSYQRRDGTALAPSSNSPFTASYTSTAQTITSAGSLSLTHSLGATPLLVQSRIKCTSSEGNYSVNDEVVVNPCLNWYGNGSSANVGGTSMVVNSTTIDIRFGAITGAFFILNKSDGTNFSIDNSKWQLIVRAWA